MIQHRQELGGNHRAALIADDAQDLEPYLIGMRAILNGHVYIKPMLGLFDYPLAD